MLKNQRRCLKMLKNHWFWAYIYGLGFRFRFSVLV